MERYFKIKSILNHGVALITASILYFLLPHLFQTLNDSVFETMPSVKPVIYIAKLPLLLLIIYSICVIMYNMLSLIFEGPIDLRNARHEVDVSCDELTFLTVKRGWKCRKKKIDISKLSKNTTEALKEVQEKLLELFDSAASSSKSRDTYRTYTTYILSLAKDIKDAIDECENEDMEAVFRDRLVIVKDNIGMLQEKINKDIEYEQDKARFKKKLQMEGYMPFLQTEQMNKLL